MTFNSKIQFGSNCSKDIRIGISTKEILIQPIDPSAYKEINTTSY
jgi:hypothetical protein